MTNLPMSEVTALLNELDVPDYPLLRLGVLLRGKQLLTAVASGDLAAEPVVMQALEQTVRAAMARQPDRCAA